MRRVIVALTCAACLALPQGASARVIELGSQAQPANPSCPNDPCEAAVRVTGLQGRAAGGPKNPYYIRRSGWLVAFTVTLARPTAEQIDFFNDNFGSPAQVRLSVLRRGDSRRTRLNYRLLRQSESFAVDDYLGSRPTFVLEEPLRVRRGYWVGITVDTWAPMFANNLPRSNWWRSSRGKTSCDPPRSLNQFAMDDLGEVGVFGCTYHGARLLYTVTYIPDNRRTSDEGR
ncbi:MAG: hypothetical protein ICV69_02795 [Thermoleophilaceae bacterium]|nr:hypothetical protein [Thermoleophilaceae bacterium]